MVASYQEFMAAGNVEHFPSGQKNAQRHNTMTLAKLFRRPRVDQSPERMERLKKMLSESKTGRQTLEFLEQKGSKMVFEPMKYYGYFAPDKNLVALNPKMSDEDLAVTFVHEVRHAWQDSQVKTTDTKSNPRSFLVNLGRSPEIGLCADEHRIRKNVQRNGRRRKIPRSGFAEMV